MKILPGLFATLLAKDRPDGFDDKAENMCADYMSGKGAATDEIKFKYIAQGAQGAIYRCQAENEAIVPNDTALKVYFDGELDLAKLEKIDTQLTEQNLRYPVYDWVDGAKFEEFLSGRRDLDPEDFARADIREAVARQFARLHGGVVNGINKNEYREYQKGWWNTYQVKGHFDVLFYLMDYRIFPGTMDLLERRAQMSEKNLRKEVTWVQSLIQDYYGNDEEAVVMCHNDLHNGNVMINEEGDLDLIFVDYDNAGYGYRAWDLLYNMLSWPEMTDEKFNQFVSDYIDERKKLGDTKITEEKLYAELGAHIPYVILERMVFAVAFGFGSEDYMAVLRDEYKKEAMKRGREVVYSNSQSLALSAILSFIFLLN